MGNHDSLRRLANAGLALVAAIALGPVMLAIAALVWLDDRGPIFYRQTRLGLGGCRFRICKFRTLRGAKGGYGLVAPVGDSRITRVGSWLRRSHLDELPQLFNIFRGDMNFVGPRPARPQLWTGVDAALRERALASRPGLTSPASIRFICEDSVLAEFDRAETLYREVVYPAKVAMDVGYFENHSIWGDLKVLGATVTAVVGQRNDSRCRQRLAWLLRDRPEAQRLHNREASREDS
ncbi:MAG: sugar transferase [Wenzhouxiangellaceae bacterium]